MWESWLINFSCSRWGKAIYFLTILVLLGGGTNVWTQSIAVGFIGFLLVKNQPETSPSKLFDISVICFVGSVLFSFFPSFEFAIPEWRVEAVKGLNANLSSLVTPQPFIVLESLPLLLTGISWIYIICNWQINYEIRKDMLTVFAWVCVALATVVIIGYMNSIKYVFASDAQCFTFFPNKNQTSNFLAMGGVVLFGTTMEYIYQRRKFKLIALLGIAGLFVVFFAIIFTLSRAGLLLYLAGCFIWSLSHLKQSWSKHFIRIGAPSILLVVSLFFLLGGSTLDKFLNFASIDSTVQPELRIKIYSDAIQLIKAHFFAGTGLSNFVYVFPQFRDESILYGSILHPESDWIWVFCEMGVVGFISLITGVSALLFSIFPLHTDRVSAYRVIPATAIVIFIIHSFVDVPGHRFGTILTVIFLFGLAHSGNLSGKALWLPKKIWKIIGYFLITVSAIWISGVLFDIPVHSKIVIEKSAIGLNKAIVDKNINQVNKHADSVLSKVPMLWQTYFERANARLFFGNDLSGAQKDFRRARYFEPVMADIPFNEGVVWIPYYPEYAVSAWRLALDRVTEFEFDLYKKMINLSLNNKQLFYLFIDFTYISPAHRFIFLKNIHESQLMKEILRDASDDPKMIKFNSSQRKIIFQRIFNIGEDNYILKLFSEYPGLALEQWEIYAFALSRQKDLESACEIVIKRMHKPPMPKTNTTLSVSRLRRASFKITNDILDLTAALQFHIDDENWPRVHYLTEIFLRMPHPPKYAKYWNAYALYELGRYEDSWNKFYKLIINK